ncbi:S8 family serine peptidase [Cellulomonas sp. URHD0024]|uniref:S8 family peptidase n=1 Tax=Cellulomonas sp. URHD0024 TaxID=1302620 RepID=UPI0018C9BA06|nr:S8 family serine peptidase [Cellulomonas sp. URHD0024]
MRAVAVAAVMVPVGAALLGAAADPQGGLWYYNDSGMDTIHKSTTGAGVTIAVLDTPLNPNAPDLAGLDITSAGACATKDGGPALPSTGTDVSAQHATGMISLIIGTGAGVPGQPGVKGVAPGAKVHHYSTVMNQDADACHFADTVLDGSSTLMDAIHDGARIVSMSFGSAAPTSQVPVEDIPAALASGTILVAATPNHADAAPQAPGAFNGVVSVAPIGPDGSRTDFASSSPHLGVLAPGEQILTPVANDNWTRYGLAEGSSHAAAYTSAALALVWSAFPKATPNQILQSLAINTGAADHPLTHDAEHGYGIVNVRHMLEHDPTQYPDVNPFLWDDPGEFGPTKAEVLAAAGTPTGPATSSPDPSPTSSATTPADGTPGTSSTPSHLLGLGAVMLVLVAVVVLVVVLLVRRRSGAVPGRAS